MSKLHAQFHLIYDSKKSQDCTAKSPNPKLTPKFPRSWEKSQAVGALFSSMQIRFFICTARCYAQRGIAMAKLSVCPSVCLSICE